MIREVEESEIEGLNRLTPVEWKYDYETLLRDFINADFFFAFIQFRDDKIVGTGNVFLKDKVAWLANIMVDNDHRGKGLGHEMTKYLVDFLAAKKCETQLLIATELGEGVYRRMGFRKQTEYQCFDSEEDVDYNFTSAIRKLENSDLKNVYKLDQEANGENRTHLIDRSCKNGFGYFNKNKELLGFFLPEFGTGLVLSRDEQAGTELLKLKHSKKGKRTLLPIENQKGISFLEKNRLKTGDKCSRMILGEENNWNPKYIYSYGSGYCG